MLRFLVNTVGDDATALTLESGTTNSEYDEKDIIAGPRSRMFRSTATATNVEVNYSTLASAPLSVDYAVIARADKLLTENTLDIVFRQKSSGGTWSDIASSGKAPIASADLVGITTGHQTQGQDYVEAISPAQNYGYGVKATINSGTEAVHFSKLYFCSAFDFGENPVIDPPPSWEPFESRQFFKPFRSTQEIETEAIIRLTWPAVTRAKLDSFRALPQILNWPIFLYDDAGDIWDWKLENVIIDSWRETFIESGVWSVDITFRRLSHYE